MSRTQAEKSLQLLKESTATLIVQGSFVGTGILFGLLGWDEASGVACGASLLCLLWLIYLTWIRDRVSP